jgi:ElaB/YqjD/DUF883 family membrane-anchored ribosome-binding protein
MAVGQMTLFTPTSPENNAAAMQTRAGNGHNVHLDQFLQDIKTVLKDGGALLKTGVFTVKERATSGAKSANRIIHHRPYAAMGLVFGLGVLVGWLAGRGVSEED